MKKLKNWWKEHRPVSAGRHKRELDLVRSCMNRSVEQEKQRLGELINRIFYVTDYGSCIPGSREIVARMMINDELIRSNRSPYFKSQFLHEISQSIVRELEKSL